MPATAGAFFALATGALVIAALYVGRDLLVPLVLAVLLAFVLAPLAKLLRRLRLGRAPASVVAVLLGFAVILAVAAGVAGQLAQLAANLPTYQAAIRAKLDGPLVGGAVARLDALLREVRGASGGTAPRAAEAVQASPAGAEGVATAPPAVVVAPAAPATEAGASEASAVEVILGVLEPLLGPLGTAGLVVVFAVFALVFREDLRDRLIRLAGSRDLHRTILALNDAAARLSRLYLAQIGLNAGYGAAVAGALWALGLPNPPLWGALAGLMRFVPFVGTPIAVGPPLLLALAVDPGFGLALAVLAVFLVGAMAMGQVVEPLVLGRSAGLSPLSVVLSATFWAALWGPIGLLLAVPLTVCLVVLGRHIEPLAFLDVMLGDRPPLRPEESFYQRALEGDADALVEEARRRLRGAGGVPAAPLAGYYDEVALRGLALAQADWSREVLQADRLRTIRAGVETLLEDLAEEAGAGGVGAAATPAKPAQPGGDDDEDAPPPPVPAAAPGAGWASEGAVVCVAGRGQFDDLAAAMAAHAMRRAGLGARALPNSALDASNLDALDPGLVRLCLLSVFEDGNSATGVRTFGRRLRRRLPGARVVVGLWHAEADSPMLAALRADAGGGGTGEVVVTSLGEAAALCAALAAAPAEAATEAAAASRPAVAPAAGAGIPVAAVARPPTA